MLLLFHIVIAVTSLIFTAFTFFLPSGLKVRISQALIALTLASGTYLVFSMKVNLLKVCAMGLMYTVVVSYGILASQRKLAAAASHS